MPAALRRKRKMHIFAAPVPCKVPGLFLAQMAELVDALVSGTSVRKYVQVRVLFWAQKKNHR